MTKINKSIIGQDSPRILVDDEIIRFENVVRITINYKIKIVTYSFLIKILCIHKS